MGICCKNSEYSRQTYNELTLYQQVSLLITEKTNKNHKKTVKFTLKPAILSLFGDLTQPYFSIKYSGIVLPGQDPANLHKKDCQDNIFIQQQDNILIAGLFDGHGENGESVVNFCISYMKAYIQLHYSPSIQDPQNFLNSLITTCSTQLRTCSSIDTSTSGTTAICLIIQNNILYIASVGDSRAIMANTYSEIVNTSKINNPYKRNFEVKKKIGFRNLTIDQKPELESEKKRILECGGKVHKMTNQFGQFIGPYRVWKQSGGVPGLAMSRSIGDCIAKECGVTDEPICETIELKPGLDLFLLIASDGVWDAVDSQEAVNYVECFRGDCKNDAVPTGIIDVNPI